MVTAAASKAVERQALRVRLPLLPPEAAGLRLETGGLRAEGLERRAKAGGGRPKWQIHRPGQCATSLQPSGISERTDETIQHFARFNGELSQRYVRAFRKVSKTTRKRELVLKLACRAVGHVEESQIVGAGVAGTTFNNVGGNRHGSSTHLGA